jgi:hypothetical protein
MKDLIFAILLTVLLYGCGEDNPMVNNNPPVTGDSAVTLWKDSLALSYGGLAWNKFGSSGTDSINVPIKIKFKCTWQDTAKSIGIVAWLLSNEYGVMLDTAYTTVNKKDSIIQFELDPKGSYAKFITWGTSALNGFTFLYDMVCFKN